MYMRHIFMRNLLYVEDEKFREFSFKEEKRKRSKERDKELPISFNKKGK